MAKTCYSLAGKFCFICHIHQTLHLWISVYFSLYRIILMEKVSIPGRLQNVPGTLLCSKRQKVLGRWNYEVAWKMPEGSRTKWWKCCPINLLAKMKSVSFIFTLKPNEHFGQPIIRRKGYPPVALLNIDGKSSTKY